MNTAKQLMVGILVLAVSLQALDRGLLWSGFYLNQRYIAENLCENRDQPMLHCEGHCQLRKVLDKLNHKKEQHLPKEAKTEVLICETWAPLWTQPLPEQSHITLFPVDELLPADRFFADILKPPIV